MILLKLKRLSLENKMRLLGIFPLLFILCLSSFMFITSYIKVNKINEVEKLVILNSKISLLLHETQKERGASAGYLGSKGTAFKEILINQRTFSNEKIEDFKNYLKLSIDHSFVDKTNIDMAIAELSQLQNIRNGVDNLSLEAKKAIAYYTNLNSILLKIIAKSSVSAEDEHLINDITAYYNFLMAKEKVGIERAVGSNVLAQKAFAPGMYFKFLTLINEQNLFMNSFYIYGFNYEKYVKEKMNDPIIKKVQEMRDEILSYGEDKNIVFNTDSTKWFQTISKK